MYIYDNNTNKIIKINNNKDFYKQLWKFKYNIKIEKTCFTNQTSIKKFIG